MTLCYKSKYFFEIVILISQYTSNRKLHFQTDCFKLKNDPQLKNNP